MFGHVCTLKPTRREVIFCQMDVSNTLSKLGDVIRVRSTYWLGRLLVVGKSCFFSILNRHDWMSRILEFHQRGLLTQYP